MNSGAIAVGHRGGVPLPSPVLFLSLLLFQFKLTLLFCFALFTAKCFSLLKTGSLSKQIFGSH